MAETRGTVWGRPGASCYRPGTTTPLHAEPRRGDGRENSAKAANKTVDGHSEGTVISTSGGVAGSEEHDRPKRPENETETVFVARCNVVSTVVEAPHDDGLETGM